MRDRPPLVPVLPLLWLLTASPAAALEVQPGIGFLAVTDVAEGATIVLRDGRGAELARGVGDALGSLIFHDLAEGQTYQVEAAGSSDAPTTATTLVFTDHPTRGFYEAQHLDAGFNYIEMRDGTLLAAMVRAPLGRRLDQGPFPTVIEYSGYDPANPESPEPMTLIASALGYATVAVNMRGSGCSGGAFDLFDLPTTADGYDIVETVAAQPWVAGGTVGMVGISFSGISQLFVAGARPPHLAAVTPLSVIADIYRAPGFPGGIFNNGFAQSWLQDRMDDARPAPDGGQQWARKRVNEGDTICLANQRLRLQTQDVFEIMEANPYYEPDLMDARSPVTWVADIEVPIFLAGAWQDEQTGSGFASMLDRLPRGRDVKITLLNGVHSSALEPSVLNELIAFLDIYVAGRLPDPGRAAGFAAILTSEILGPGNPTMPVPADRYDGITRFGKARRRFESSPRFRVLFENGAGTSIAGLPAPTFEMGFRYWPPRHRHDRAWYFQEGGRLARRRPRATTSGVDAYRPDPGARPIQTLPGQGESDSWALMPAYDWLPLAGDAAVAYVSDPLTEDLAVVGPSSVDLWMRSSASDTDIQVTLSEVRADGLETYVQSGWLRASHRRNDPKRQTRIAPWPTHLESDAAAMPEGKFTRVRVGLLAAAHLFRQGSRIRISIEAPGGDRTRWAFDTFVTGGAVVNEIAYTRARPSRLVLPVLRKVDAPPGAPPCPGLRGQPCRSYVPAINGG
jgi:hypothetical protein